MKEDDSLSSINGFLLTRQWSERTAENSNGVALSYWFSTDFGPMEVVVEHQQPLFFIDAESRPDIEKRFEAVLESSDWRVSSSPLLNFEAQPVAVVYFQSQRDLYRARDVLKEMNLNVYESDIQPTDRFLMERFVTGPARITGNLQQGSHYIMQRAKLRNTDYQPAFRVMSLDIETSPSADRLYSIGFVYGPASAPSVQSREVLLCSGAMPSGAPDWLSVYPDERSLLTAFVERFQALDPDIVIGWNVVNFDLRVLQRRADQLRVRLPLGRGQRAIDWRQSRADREHRTCVVPGRWVLDGIETMKSATYNFESFSLQAVSRELLGRGKLLDDVDHRAETIADLYRSDPLALSEYNLEDCQLVWDIFHHARLFDFATQRAALTGLPGDRYGGSVAGFDFRYLPRLHRKGRVAPMLPINPQEVGSPGGYVMESSPGLYRNVLVLDFKSLYPSIIRTFKVDPLARVVARSRQLTLYADALDEDKNHLETQQFELADMVPGFNGAAFSKRECILPELIGELWSARDRAKAHHNVPLSTAIKILMNAFYGVLGTPGCRFFDHRLPSSITLRGHQILNQTRDYIERLGHAVIYGDTDSIFVHLSEERQLEDREVDEIGQALALELNRWWRDCLREKYDIDSYLELEYETHYQRFFMPTLRGAEVGSKKRYAGLCQRRGAPQLVFKGLEAVRTDWTPLAREFQRGLFQRVFSDQSIDEYVLDTIADIRSGARDAELVFRKRIRRPLAGYVRNRPPHVQAAIKADEWLLKCGKNARYQRGGWIKYVLTTHGPEPLECVQSPLDYDVLLMRQIAPIVDAVGQFLGVSYAQLTNPQLGLFS